MTIDLATEVLSDNLNQLRNEFVLIHLFFEQARDWDIFFLIYLIKALAITSNSSLEDKLEWAFMLYDIGKIHLINHFSAIAAYESVL